MAALLYMTAPGRERAEAREFKASPKRPGHEKGDPKAAFS